MVVPSLLDDQCLRPLSCGRSLALVWLPPPPLVFLKEEEVDTKVVFSELGQDKTQMFRPINFLKNFGIF